MTTKAVTCRLCFDKTPLSELSRNANGSLSDICLMCREAEIRAVLRSIEAIIGYEEPSNDVTQTISLTVSAGCGHVVDCACKTCHICEEFCVYKL